MSYLIPDLIKARKQINASRYLALPTLAVEPSLVRLYQFGKEAC